LERHPEETLSGSAEIVHKMLDFGLAASGLKFGLKNADLESPIKNEEECLDPLLLVMLLTSAVQYIQSRKVILEDSDRSKLKNLLVYLSFADTWQQGRGKRTDDGVGTLERVQDSTIDRGIMSLASNSTGHEQTASSLHTNREANTNIGELRLREELENATTQPEQAPQTPDEADLRFETCSRPNGLPRRGRGRTGCLLATGIQGVMKASHCPPWRQSISGDPLTCTTAPSTFQENAYRAIGEQHRHSPGSVAALDKEIAPVVGAPRPSLTLDNSSFTSSASNDGRESNSAPRSGDIQKSNTHSCSFTREPKEHHHDLLGSSVIPEPVVIRFPDEVFQVAKLLYHQLLCDRYPMLPPGVIQRLVGGVLASPLHRSPMLYQLFLWHSASKLVSLIPENFELGRFDETNPLGSIADVVPARDDLPDGRTRCNRISTCLRDLGRRLTQLWRSLERRRSMLIAHKLSIKETREVSDSMAILSATLYGLGFPLAQMQVQWMLEYRNWQRNKTALSERPSKATAPSMHLESLIPSLVHVTRVVIQSIHSSRVATKAVLSKTPESPPMAEELLSSILSLLIDLSHADTVSCSLLCRAGITHVLQALWGMDLQPCMDIATTPAFSLQPKGLPFDLRVLLLVLLVNLLEQSTEARMLLLHSASSTPDARSESTASISLLTYLALVITSTPPAEPTACCVEPFDASEFEFSREHAISASYAALALACAAVREPKWVETIRFNLPNLSFRATAEILEAFQQFLAHVEEAETGGLGFDTGTRDTLHELITSLRQL
jgi:hypothetical protein